MLNNKKHWKPILFIIILLAWGIYHYIATERPLTAEAKNVVNASLSSYYLNIAMKNQPTNIDSLPPQEAEEYGKKLMAMQDVNITQLTARGRGGDVIVRVEYFIGGGTPPDEKSVRYFAMTYNSLTGWRIKWETSPKSYYLKIF